VCIASVGLTHSATYYGITNDAILKKVESSLRRAKPQCFTYANDTIIAVEDIESDK
jgi:hypothetical protein